MSSVARWCAAHRLAVLAAWILIAAGMIFASSSAGSNYAAGTSLSGTPSPEAAALLQRAAPSVAGDTETIAIQAKSGVVTVNDNAVPANEATALVNLARAPNSGTLQVDVVGSVAAHTTGVATVAGPEYLPAGPGHQAVAVANVCSTASPQDAATSALITNLRSTVIPAALHGNHLEVLVGGQTALSDDFANQLSTKLPLFVIMVVALSFLVLMVLFRSLLIPATAAIMIVVFSSFIVTTDRTIKMIGLGMAVAILIDALLIRTVLVPAVMHTIGKANWHLPATLDRRLPQLKLEADDTEPADLAASALIRLRQVTDGVPAVKTQIFYLERTGAALGPMPFSLLRSLPTCWDTVISRHANRQDTMSTISQRSF